MQEKKWFIIKTNPRAEKKVAARLEKLGVEYYLPTRKELKTWHDRKVYKDVVLFKSYIFVLEHLHNRKPILETIGVVKFLFVAGQIAIVKNSEINTIKLFCDAENDYWDSKNFVKGNGIEIVTGVFTGFTGELLEIGKGDKIKIKLTSLSEFACMEIEKKDIKILNKVA